MPQPRRAARRATIALAFGIATSFASSAFADEPAPDEPPPEPDDAPLELPAWAVILGVGASPSVGGVGGAGGGLGGLAGPWAPVVSGGFEARMLPTLWLIGEARGAVSQSRYDDGYIDGTSTHWGLGGDLGIRHVLTDPEPLELSWLLVMRGQYGESIAPDDTEAWGWEAGGRMGLVLQHHFTDWLALRARVDLLKLGYQRSRYQADALQKFEHDRWFAELTAEPSVAMRFGF